MGGLLGLGVDAVDVHEHQGADVERPVDAGRRNDRFDRQLVAHLDRRRNDPRADDARDRIAGLVGRRKRREQRLRALRRTQHAHQHLGDDPGHPLAADHDPGEVVTQHLGLPGRRSDLHRLALRRHERQPQHVVHREAVLETVRAAGVLGDVTADRADALRAGVGRVEVPVGCERARDVEVDDARLHPRRTVGQIDRQDLAHA